MPRPIGPGPGAYLLPSTVGYQKHDITRYRNPAYTMGNRLTSGPKPFGPGPQANISKLTRYGPNTPPAYTLGYKIKPLEPFNTPGPGTYAPEKGPVMTNRAPVFSISPRCPPLRKFNTPGPNQYAVPSTIGPRVPHIPASCAYSMGAKLDSKRPPQSPGPAGYGGTNVDLYKNKNPQYTMGARCAGVGNKSPNPGPAAYLPKLPHKIPGGRTFGVRTERQPYITADDHMPCAD